MTSTSFISAMLACTFLAASASARHMHRPQLHQHQRRQAVTITAFETSSRAEDVPAASITAGNDAIADIQQIQAGLSDLPGDLLSYVQAVEARLETVESMLQVLMSSTAVSPAVSTSVASAAPPSTFISSTTEVATTPIPPPDFYAWQSPSPASSIRSSSQRSSTTGGSHDTTTITSRVTSTRLHTITIPAAISTSSYTSVSGGFPTSTFASSGNWTLPASTSGRPAIAPAADSSATRTVLLAPAPTAWEQR